MKMILPISVLIIIILSLGLFFVVKKISIDTSTINKAVYGEKVVYKKGTPIQFPDFILIYRGEKELSGENGSTWYMLFYLFEISDGENTKEISWSSGLGDIGPNPFEFNNKKYNIEKGISEKFGKLNENELVINLEK